MTIKRIRLLIYFVFIIFITLSGFTKPTVKAGLGELKTAGASLVSRVAPGEFLPISVKLMNFGAGKRVDVAIDYQILDSQGQVVSTETETVAVETTASFVKHIQIPLNFSPGEYTAISRIEYQGQEVPAISRFQFTVEKKIAGIFISQFIIYGIITLLVALAFAIISRLIIKRRASRLSPHQYPDIPKEDRVFYELISDMIMQMRQHEGDEAIDVAGNIDGLKIDEVSGRVLAINKDPAEIVVLLMLYYEKKFGKKINLGSGKISEDKLSSIDRNIEIIRKYFK